MYSAVGKRIMEESRKKTIAEVADALLAKRAEEGQLYKASLRLHEVGIVNFWFFYSRRKTGNSC